MRAVTVGVGVWGVFSFILSTLMITSSGEGPRPATAGSLAELFSSDDYPIRALRQRIEGTVGFRVEVDSNGALTDCIIVETSGNSDLDAATCSIVRERARFRPARDAEGRSVPDTVQARVTWRIGEESPYMTLDPERRVVQVQWSDPDPVCSETLNEISIGRLSASQCREEFGPAMLLVRNAQGAIEMTMLRHQVPEGRPIDDGRALGYGQAVRLEELELEIGSNGKVGRCRVTRLESRPDPALPLPGDVSSCSFYQQSDVSFAPAEETSGTRRLRILSAIYLKRRGTD